MEEIKKETDRRSNGRIAALGGLLLALSLISLYGASFVPGFEITLYTVSSIFVPIMMIETKGKGGWVLYGACSILALVLLPNKLAAFPYIFFFGIYGIIKFYIEKIKSPIIQMNLKFATFTIIMVVVYHFFHDLFFGVITVKEGPAFILLLLGELLFFVYDILLTGAINFYYKRFHGRI